MRCWISAALFLLATASLSLAQQPAASASPSPSPQAAQASPSPASDKDEPEIEIPVPIGAPVTGIKIPHYGPDGKLQMEFFAGKARKLDDDHVEMEDLTIMAYNTDGSKFDVEVPKSVLNLKTRILKGNHVFINRDDFQIEGDAIDFQTKTRFGKITGGVKMTIYNTEKLSQ